MTAVAENNKIKIKKLDVVGDIVSNAYLMECKESKESVLVDTPGDAGIILKQLRDTRLKYILITHNHFDHLGALLEIKSQLQVPVAAHLLDILPSPPDILLNDGDVISFGDVQLKVLHTPGHTPGSLCFYTDGYLISGDTLFPGGPGKTASPAVFKQIVESITKKILNLPDDTLVFSGHGDTTVLRKEKEEIAVFKSKRHDTNLCGDVLWLSS